MPRSGYGVTVIDGGCPGMHEPTANAGHKIARLVLSATGNLPRRV